MQTIRNIMVPVNFSEASLVAAEYAASLAQAYKARLYVLHVKEPFPVHGRIVAGSWKMSRSTVSKRRRPNFPK